VAALIADGLPNREIAARLGITERSAESHVERIRDRMGFRSRAQIAAWHVATGR
jgi:DNA-binding CsgD family transcriptional regulator